MSLGILLCVSPYQPSFSTTVFFSVDRPPSLPLKALLLVFPPVVTKGFVYSSFLKPYNARRSHSDVSVGSHSSTESEPSSSSPRFPRQNSSSALTFNPGSMAVSFTSGSCQKQPQEATASKELDQETLGASFNLGCSESSPSRCPSDPDRSPQPRSWDFPEAASALHQPAPAGGSYRNARRPETVGCSLPARGGQGRDLTKGCTRTTPSLEDKKEEPESREAEGNQVSALVTVWRRRGSVGGGTGSLGAAGAWVRIWAGLTGRSCKAHTETRCKSERVRTGWPPSVADPSRALSGPLLLCHCHGKSFPLCQLIIPHCIKSTIYPIYLVFYSKSCIFLPGI